MHSLFEANAHPFYRPAFTAAFWLPRYWPTWLGLALLRAMGLLPPRVRDFLAARAGDVYFWFSAKRRHIAQINIRLCFPELDARAQQKLVRDHFRVAMQAAADMSWLWWASAESLERRVRVLGVEHYREQIAHGHNVILLTCHNVALETGVIISRHYPHVIVMKRARNELVNWFLVRSRTRFHVGAFLREQGLRPLVRAIKDGACFYYLPDEDMGPKESAFVPFFGVPAATLTTVGRLARMCDAAVIPCFARRRDDGQGYDLVLKPALENFPTDDPVADARRMNEELEKGIREAPEQYMWTFKRFKSRPDGSASPYG